MLLGDWMKKLPLLQMHRDLKDSVEPDAFEANEALDLVFRGIVLEAPDAMIREIVFRAVSTRKVVREVVR